jgi:uncharacterized RDD family membrane protein YckC
MDVWIIQNGEKSGPLPDYEVRSGIQSGQFTADTPAWHEGMADWQPLSAIPLFASEFVTKREASQDEEKSAAESAPTPPPLQAQASPHLIRRFWARWFDLYLYSGFWWLGMWLAGRDIGAVMSNIWLILFQFVPWFAIEAVLLHRFGTTPGKWLLGIGVRNEDGSLLALPQAVRRSLRVMFLGIGLGWGIVALICQIMAVFTTKRLGRPLWDMAGGHQLVSSPLGPLRIAAYAVGLFAALQLQMIVVAPHVFRQMKEQFPSLHEQIEKNPPWHLPENQAR